MRRRRCSSQFCCSLAAVTFGAYAHRSGQGEVEARGGDGLGGARGSHLQGLLEIKDTHRHLEGPVLLGIALVQGPGAVCVLDFKQTLYRPRLVLQGQLNQTKRCEVAPFSAP